MVLGRMSKLHSGNSTRPRQPAPQLRDVDSPKAEQNDVSGESSQTNFSDGYQRASRKIATTNANTDARTYRVNDDGQEILETLRLLYEKEKLCDVILSVDKMTFKVHKVVLVACSGYFYDHFVTEDKSTAISELPLSKIPLSGTRSDVMRKILDGVYSSKIALDSSSVEDILAAASFLRISSIAKACQSYLCDTLRLGNCLDMLKVASRYKLQTLMEEAYKCICANFTIVSKQSAFNKLHVNEILELIPRQDILVDSEIKVFCAIVKWIEYARSERLKYIGRVMKHVRFAMMTKNQLVDNVEASSLVSESSEMNDFIKEAIRYHLLPFRRSVLQSPRTVPRSPFTMDVVVACGGLMSNAGRLSTTRKMYYFDSKDNDWQPFAELPEPRYHHAVTTLGNFLYIAGGASGMGDLNSSRKVWRYDAITETWLRCANMLHPRQMFQIEVMDSRVYAVGGRNDSSPALSSVERYNPSTNAWSAVEGISAPRRYVALATACGRLYAVGGLGNDTITRRVEGFNPVSSQWEKRCPLHNPRYGGALHLVKNSLWLFGGTTIDEHDRAGKVVQANSIEVYSPSSDQWTIVEKHHLLGKRAMEMPQKVTENSATFENKSLSYVQTARTEDGSCVVNNEIFFVAGLSGYKSDLLNDVERLSLSDISVDFRQQKITGDGISCQSTSEAANAKPKPTNYPFRCTGIACVALTLFKKPCYKFQRPYYEVDFSP